MCLLYLQRCQSVTESRGTEGEGYSVIGDAYLIVWMEKKRQKEHSGGAHALSSLCCCVTATWGVCHFKYMWKKKQSLPIEHLWVFIIFFSFFWTTLTIVFYFILRFVCGHVDYHHHNLVFLKFSETHKWSRRISLTNTWAQTSWMSCQDNELHIMPNYLWDNNSANSPKSTMVQSLSLKMGVHGYRLTVG